MDYLVFRLYGAMASWGEIAVGESRHSANYPSKSAITGLIAAALGLRREDPKQNAVTENLQQAVKLISTGMLLKDYHTAQAPDSVGRFKYRTRRDELTFGKERLGTILSSREYRTDSQAIVAVRVTDSFPYSLIQVREALRTPIFHLYLGRKSCPLAAPLGAVVLEGGNFREALDKYPLGELSIDAPSGSSESRWLKQDLLTHYYWEGGMADFSEDVDGFEKSHVQTLTRHDLPLSRVRWQFQPRQEHMWLQRKGTD
ncbi:MAG: type I-E CRISPR-associated protein Cas5/CasD [Gammaproteobacteria bacterium]|nr:type I-E CRISPR-associated protein Cas5/CasD [Gammaproteobacteria bacterium]